MNYLGKLRQRSAALKAFPAWEREQLALTQLRTKLTDEQDAPLFTGDCLIHAPERSHRDGVHALLVISRGSIGYGIGSRLEGVTAPIGSEPNDEGRAFYIVDEQNMTVLLWPGARNSNLAMVASLRTSALVALRIAERLRADGLDAAVAELDVALKNHADNRPAYPC